MVIKEETNPYTVNINGVDKEYTIQLRLYSDTDFEVTGYEKGVGAFEGVCFTSYGEALNEFRSQSLEIEQSPRDSEGRVTP